jgi:hypothetical protein
MCTENHHFDRSHIHAQTTKLVDLHECQFGPPNVNRNGLLDYGQSDVLHCWMLLQQKTFLDPTRARDNISTDQSFFTAQTVVSPVQDPDNLFH